MYIHQHSFKVCVDFNNIVLKGFTELCCYSINITTVTNRQYLWCISYIWLISNLFNKFIIQVNTDPVYQSRASLPNMNESHFLCVTVPMCPAVLVPVEKWSGQVECWWGLRVVVSWRFGTATEPASEPRSAGESSAAAHSHCEPRPCLQEAKCQGGWRCQRSWSVSPIYCIYVCMEFMSRGGMNYSSESLLMPGYNLSWEV